jgi:two-component system NtrC family sensor kinase
LATGIAHEINNPLGIISNLVQILLKNPAVDPSVRQDLVLIQEEIQRMSRITKGLLNFSRASEPRKDIIQLNEVLESAVSLLRFQLKSQCIELQKYYDESLPLISGDPNHMLQALLNILLNSVQAMPEGGQLVVRSKAVPGRPGQKGEGSVQIELIDTGQGIDDKYLDKIFDPYFTTKEWGRGTGLGLSISYGIVRDHGGAIDVKSMPGQGTFFRITLPVSQS